MWLQYELQTLVHVCNEIIHEILSKDSTHFVSADAFFLSFFLGQYPLIIIHVFSLPFKPSLNIDKHSLLLMFNTRNIQAPPFLSVHAIKCKSNHFNVGLHRINFLVYKGPGNPFSQSASYLNRWAPPWTSDDHGNVPKITGKLWDCVGSSCPDCYSVFITWKM